MSNSGVRRGGLGGGFNPPPNRKKCCRKMMLFPMFLYLATNFPKIDKNLIFPLNFHQKFSKFSQTIVFFVQTRENLTRGFKNFLQNRLKYNIFCNFLLEFFANFRKFSGVRRAPPPDPLRGRTPYLEPPKFFPAYGTELQYLSFK